MRPRLLAAALALVLAAPVVVPPDARADFDVSGRGKHKPPPGVTKPGPGGKPPVKKRPKDEEDASKGPGAEALIARYTGIVLSQPGQPFPLQRLGQLYRERDGNLKKLIEDFEKRAGVAGAEQWAARVALAGVYKQEGRYEEAVRTYQAAIADKPKEPAAMLALGQLLVDRGDKVGGRAQFEQALPLLKAGVDQEQTTRTLLGLCLDLNDYDAAKRFHEALVKTANGSLFVRAELGRELMARGRYERAEVEYRDVVKAAAGDNRVLAPALMDLGQALTKLKKMPEALATLKRALAVAGAGAGVRSQILQVMTDAFRTDGKIPELITILEAEHPSDAQRLTTLGTLYDEIGEVDKALATYRKSLAADNKQIDVHVKLVHLLNTAGDLEAAIKGYEALIKAAPNSPEYVFELCDTLISRGDRAKAMRLVAELEGRQQGNPTVLAAVAAFYENNDEKDKALKVMQKLASSGVDPQYIVDLGDRYFQAGDKKKALETWSRLRTIIPNRAKAASTLGDVYLEHDMPSEGLGALREAVQLEPNSVVYKKALAMGLERTATSLGSAPMRYGEARALWEELLAGAGRTDKNLAREARTNIVKLWGLTRELPAQVSPLANRFAATPPDLEAGRLLAEVQRKLHRLPEAEATLRRIVTLAPGDEESLLALERVLVQEQNVPGAIEVLLRLVEVDPKRAREFYQRMAQYAAELYRDDEAIKYAAKAVELSPQDPTGHQKLGEMYKRRQDIPHAIAEYRLAITQNERLFPVYLELGELLLSTGQVDEADRLFRRVVRSSPDEELVARAARTSMRINLGKNTLGELERELLPVAVGNPQKAIYRRLLVEVYGAMTFPLVQKLRSGDPRGPAAAAARAELGRIGARAVKPLLDALADDKESQQKIAIEVLAYVENKAAGPALYNYATGTADKSLRVRAMIACGALRDAALLGRYEQMLAPKEGTASLLPSDAIAVAAAWGVARMGDRKADALLVKLLASSSPDVRALSAVGLGLTHDRKYVPSLSALARATEASPTARAAAVHALAELGADVDPALLLANAGGGDLLLRQASLLAMARLAGASVNGAAKEDANRASGPADAIAAAVFSPDDALRATAALAGAALATKSYRRNREALPVPDGPLTLREVLAGLAPEAYGAESRATALVTLGPALRKAAVAAVSTSPDRARVVADALLAEGDKLGLQPFTAPGDKLDAKRAAEVGETIESIAQAVVPGVVALERHPAVDVRTRAVELLARRPEPAAEGALIDALGDPDEGVRRAVLSAVGPIHSERLTRAVAALVKDSPSWPLRVRAAEALGRLGKGSPAAVLDTLLASARTDTFALVREASARAVAALDAGAAKPLLAELAKSDAEPRVRETAADLLKGIH